MLEPLIALLELLIFEHKPRPWVVRSWRACVELCQRLVPFRRRSQVPQFVTNSHLPQWEGAQRQYALAAGLGKMWPPALGLPLPKLPPNSPWPGLYEPSPAGAVAIEFGQVDTAPRLFG